MLISWVTVQCEVPIIGPGIILLNNIQSGTLLCQGFRLVYKQTLCKKGPYIKASFSVHDITFLNFQNKSHNIKALVVLSHSWSPFLTLVYTEKMNFCGALCALLEYFCKKILSQINSFKRTHLGWDSFTELFLSNIMKYGKNHDKWQTSIQSMSWYEFEWLLGLLEEKGRKL